MKTVAVLYALSASSPYAKMPEVDCWDRKRNALLYRGDSRVILHPPCGPWSPSVAHQTALTHAQGKYHAPFALKVARSSRVAILEHPARSRLWEAAWKLPYPLGFHAKAVASPLVDLWGGWTLEVDQRRFGHELIKLTWLYMIGIDQEDVHLPPPGPKPERSNVIRVDKRSGTTWYRTKHELGSQENRKRTPPAFARWLVDLVTKADA